MDNWNQNNRNQNNMNGQSIPPSPASRRQTGFLAASLICGILALCTFCTGIFPLVFGSLGIIFAVLSKRKGISMEPMGIIGISTSIIGMVIGLFLTVYSLYMVFSPNSPMPELRNEMDIIMERMYGMDMDEYLDRISTIN